MALLTVAQWRTATNLTTPADSQVQAAIDAISQGVRDLLVQNFEAATYTEYYDAPCYADVITLDQGPLVSVASVYCDGSGFRGQGTNAFAADTLLTAGTDYMYITGKKRAIQSLYCNWAQLAGGYGRRPPIQLTPMLKDVPGAIKVTYTAGYTTVPADVRGVVALAVSAWLRMIPNGFLAQSASYIDTSASFNLQNLSLGILKSPDVWNVLSRYTASGGVFIG